MRLEQQIEQGAVAYLMEYVYDAEAATLQIVFARDPEVLTVFGTLAFTQVQDYSSMFDSEEERLELQAGILLESLIGIHEAGPSGASLGDHFIIRTDTREISFTTPIPPSWSPTAEGKQHSPRA